MQFKIKWTLQYNIQFTVVILKQVNLIMQNRREYGLCCRHGVKKPANQSIMQNRGICEHISEHLDTM